MTLTTTPTFVFKISDDPADYEDVMFTFYQGGVPRLTKHKTEISWSDDDDFYVGTCTLTEEEMQRLRHAETVIISVVIVPEPGKSLEVERIKKKVYYVQGERLRVGLEDETTTILVSVNEISRNTQMTVDVAILNTMKGQYKAGNGIRIENDETISIGDLLLGSDPAEE